MDSRLRTVQDYADCVIGDRVQVGPRSRVWSKVAANTWVAFIPEFLTDEDMARRGIERRIVEPEPHSQPTPPVTTRWVDVYGWGNEYLTRGYVNKMNGTLK